MRNFFSEKTGAIGAVAGSTVIFGATLTWFLWPLNHWEPDREAAVATIAALLVLISSLWNLGRAWPEVVNADKKILSAHDARLAEKVNGIFSVDRKYFLKNHPFHISFDRSNTNFIHDVAQWDGAEFEFDDPETQSKMTELSSLCGAASRMIAYGSFPVDGNVEYSTFMMDQDRGGVTTPETQKKIDDMEASGIAVAQAADELARLARSKM